jgi:SAM-dependent methyltransferase
LQSKSTVDLPTSPWSVYNEYDYHEFWGGRNYEDIAERNALKKLLPTTRKRLLDLGANYGRLSSEYLTFQEIFLVDGALSAMKQALAGPLSNRYSCIVCDIRQTPFPDNFFDVIVCVRTLHHQPDINPLFTEANRLLQPKGMFVFEFANKRNLKQMVLDILGLSRVRLNDTEPILRGQGIYNFHPEYILNCLHKHGFTAELRYGVSLFRWKPIKNLLPLSFILKIDSMFQDLAGKYFLSPSVFICARKISPGATQIPHVIIEN